MARRMREHDWASSPLGDPGQWPLSLRTACRICLTSRFPMIVWWGPELYFLYNDAYLPLLGTKHPALGKPGDEVWGEIWDIIGPMLGSVLTTGEATWSEDMLLPINRHGYWEETYWTYSYSPLYDDSGRVAGAFTAVSDTTERVVGERRLAVLHELGAQAGSARTVAEACSLVVDALQRGEKDIPFAAIYLRRGDRNVLAAASPPGVAAPALAIGPAGWPVDEAAAADSAVRVDDLAGRRPALPSGGWRTAPTQAVVLPLTGEAGREPAGAMVLAASSGRTLDDAYEAFLGLVAQQTASLINGAVAYEAQQQRAEELAELDRAKTAFFSNISHEFRTPLTLIMGPLAELRARLGETDPVSRRELDVIHRNGLRLGKLVNSLLDFSRLEAGRLEARFEPVDLAALTTDLASLFRSAMESAGLSYSVDCHDVPEPVYVDRDMWEKVILNLLSNALKFTFGGSVRVSLRYEDQQAVVRVADTGTGIPAAEMPRLFERFHRIANARARSNEGSGIGLAMVRELVLQHGGTITAASIDGAGTEFTVRLPTGAEHLPADRLVPGLDAGRRTNTTEAFLQEALRWLPGDGGPVSDPVPGADRAADWPADRPGGKARPRILLADDNADMKEYLQRLLAPTYQVTSTADGLAALEAARAHPPDLVISDVMMPGLDGLQLVAALRRDTRTASVPVLLLSARAGQEAAIEGLDAGADDYLVKPFSGAELLARVRGNLQLAGMRSQHARWRAALIESLQEAFFVAGEDGSVIEVNAAFTDLLGYGRDELPYAPSHPWWPAADTDPEAHRQTAESFAQLTRQSAGSLVAPVIHRDGHQLWIAASFNQVNDPETGRRMVVGTLRDVTAEHYAGQREAALAAMGLLLSQADTVPDAVRGAIEEVRELWQARRVLAATFDGAADSDEPAIASTDTGLQWSSLPDEIRRAIGALRTGRLLHPADAGPGAVGITLDHPSGLLALWIELDAGRQLSGEDQTLLALLCGHLVQALHRIHRSEQQRETALALQRAILGPAELPSGFAVRYEPATRPLEVGGDWYDIVNLPDGRIGIVVGDAVGHGLGAATVMGQLRSACRALLLLEQSPAQVLTALDRFTERIPGAMCSTVFCGVLDPESGRLTYSSAGHPPGILASPDSGLTLLEDGRSLSLAVKSDVRRSDAECLMPGRATLLLYTDGLVERRRRALDAGIAIAGRAVLASRSASPEELASRLMTELAPDGGYEDDVALLIYRHPAPLSLIFPMEMGELRPARAAMRRWLAQCSLSADAGQGVLVAAGEACANAVEHARQQGLAQLIRLTASVTADELRLTVSNDGRWREPDRGSQLRLHRGNGIPLMRALMTDVTILPGSDGTTVDMHLRI